MGAYVGGRWAAVVGGAAAATLLALGVPAVGAEEPPTEEPATTVPETTVPPGTDTTIPDPGGGPTSSIVGPPGTATSTTTSTEPVGPTTTEQSPGEPASTTTLPPVPPSTDLTCVDSYEPIEHRFLIDESIEEGEGFDDPASDFSVVFTQVDFVEDHLVVTFEASHPVAELYLAGLYGVHMTGFFYGGAEPVVVRTVELNPAFGRSVVWAAFCFVDAGAIGAPEPLSPTVTAAPSGPGGGEAPVTTTARAPAEEGNPPEVDGTLPKTGSDALPPALAGAGLVAVGGGLLLGRRVRRVSTGHPDSGGDHLTR